MKVKVSPVLGCGLALIATGILTPGGSFAQSGEQAADQSAFQDDIELMRVNDAQMREVAGEEQSAEEQAALDEKRNQAYRLYAEKRVNELEKLKGANAQNNSQIAIMQRWLKADAAMRLRDQQTINNLRKRIASMEQSRQQVMSNLGGDVGAMREAANDARSNERFRQQMAINYFNELQTEMGPAHMDQRQTYGTSYGMGGMGFSGGQTLFGGGY
jgi:hypothetical protein